MEKIEQLSVIRKEKGCSYRIEIDGGITPDNAALVKEKGCDIFVAGSAVFGAEDIAERVELFKRVLKTGKQA